MAIKSNRDDIAGRLKTARERIFPTAADAARALDMKPVTVRAHESGQNGIDFAYLERYARRYGVDIGWLLTGRGDDSIDAARHEHMGELVSVRGVIMDGQWIADDPASDLYPTLGEEACADEFAVYSDPRFPEQIVTAYRVRSTVADGPYADGSIIFAVPRELIGYRDGDHVVIVLEDRAKDMVQWTLRRARRSGPGGVMFEAVLSDSPALPFTAVNEGTPWTNVVGVVVGSLQRRQVNELSLDARVGIERDGAAVRTTATASPEQPRRPDTPTA